MFLALRITKLVYESQSFSLLSSQPDFRNQILILIASDTRHREANISGAKHINSHTKKYEEATTVSLMRN